MFVGAALRASAEAEARRVLGRLNGARVGGRDYEADDFLALRAVCAPAGVTLDVAAGETARDALYRGAVEVALDGAGAGPGALRGATRGSSSPDSQQT